LSAGIIFSKSEGSNGPAAAGSDGAMAAAAPSATVLMKSRRSMPSPQPDDEQPQLPASGLCLA